MPFDITKFRADPDQALQQALSSRDINEQATSIQQQSSRLRFQGIARAGEAIGGGLERGLVRAFDPTEAMNRANAMRQSQMMQREQANVEGIEAIRRTRQDLTGQQLADLEGDKRSAEDEFKSEAAKRWGNTVPYNEIPQNIKDKGIARMQELRGPKGGAGIHAYGKDAEMAFGPRGTKQYAGYSREDVPNLRSAMRGEVFGELEMESEMRAFLQQRGIKIDYGKSLSREGKVGPKYILDRTGSVEKARMGEELQGSFDDQTLREYSVNGKKVMMNMRQAKALNLITERFIRDNITETVTRAPRIAVDKDGNYSQTIGPKQVQNMAGLKDKLDNAFANNLLGMESGAANNLKARWDISPKVMNQIMGMSWLNSLNANDQKAAQQIINEIGGYTRKNSRLGAIAVSRMNGVTISDDDVMQAMDIPDAPAAINAIKDKLEQLKGLSPAVKGMLMPAAAGSKNKSQFDLTLQRQVDESMVTGTFAGANGPLYGLMSKDITAPEAAEVYNMLGDASTGSENFQKMTGRYTAIGIPEEDARAMATEQMAEFDRQYSAYLRTRDPSDPTKEWTKKEMEQAAEELAKEITEPSIRAYKSVASVSGREALNSVAHRPAGTMSQVDAQKVVDRAMNAKPELRDKGLVEIDVGQGRTVQAINGKAMGFKIGDKASTFSLLKGDFPMHLTESFHVASKVARDIAGIDFEKGFKWNSLNPMKSSGDRAVDKMMSAQVSGDGSSMYLWLKNYWRKDNKAKTDTDAAEALYINLSEAAKQSGESMFNLRDRLNAAAANSEDPVLEATAIFLGEALSPHKFTLKDISDIEGGYPVNAMNNAATQAATEMGDVPGKDNVDKNNQLMAAVQSDQAKALEGSMGAKVGTSLGTGTVGSILGRLGMKAIGGAGPLGFIAGAIAPHIAPQMKQEAFDRRQAVFDKAGISKEEAERDYPMWKKRGEQ